VLPTPHGFGDDARSRELRRRPPAEALGWVEQELDARVVAVRAYKGGSSSAVHGLRIERGDGHVDTVVLRRYVLDHLNLEEPDLAEREARILGLLDACAVPTPEVLAVDPTGDDAGVPTVVMTRVPGRLDWSPTALEPWLRRLAEVLPPIHEAPITEGVQEFTPYAPDSWDPPAGVDAVLWERAVAVFHGPRLDPDRVFLHRDYHPGNVLWRRGRVTGVVDWQAASLGPRAADVWHCRGNLIGRFGLEIADRFLELWLAMTGATYHPWTEAVMLVDALGWGGRRSANERAVLADLLARRLAELGA
jgi:aminoglycoside phosphotransferase (APT) family kinase protein